MAADRWVLFDLNGTLLDPDVIERALEPAVPEGFALDALDDAILQAMTDSLAGDYRPFPEYLRAAVARRLTLLGRDRGGAEAAVAAATRMPAFAEAPSALEHLREAGFRLAVLTNSARATGDGGLRHAGIREYFEHVVGSDEVGIYKPSIRVYEHALARLGAPAGDCWLVAAHGWDVLGAARAGLRTGWVSRKERVLLATVPEPDVVGTDLVTVARQIAGGD
jgi:2-haloacid dehalogenase